jgi:hypothetical protein
MNRPMLQRPWQIVDSDEILSALTDRQHVRPHDGIAVAVGETCDRLGVCPNAAGLALRWLGVDPNTPVGRLRRTELMQLARSIHRFWRQAAAAAEAAPQPAPTPAEPDSA